MFGFTGEETDSNGLVNLRARYYNPAIGQFFSQDPLEGSAVQPLSLGRYAYVVNNPINHVDPSGLECLNPPCEGVGTTFVIPFANGGGEITIPAEGTVLNAYRDQSFGYGGEYTTYAEGILADLNAFFAASEEFAADAEPSAVFEYNVSHGGQVAEVELQTPFGRRVFLFAYHNAQALQGYIDNIGNGTINTPNVAPAWYMSRDPYHRGQPVNPGDAPPEPPNNCDNDTRERRSRQWYFRGTTVGFAGNQVMLDLNQSSTSTQPGIATVFATVAETMHNGSGIVYGANLNDLQGVSIGLPNFFRQIEQEVVFNIPPLEFASRSSLQVSSANARVILLALGINIPNRMDISEQTSFLRTLPRLNKAQIELFVQSARLGL